MTGAAAELARRRLRGGDALWVGLGAALGAAAAARAVGDCLAMPPGGVRMSGGWAMSMAWMRMPGQSWPGAAAAFLEMWTTMTAAMMLPALLPLLRRYRRETRATPAVEARTAGAVAGYFAFWAAVGALVFGLGAAAAGLVTTAPATARLAPWLFALVTLAAGVAQTSAWKARRLNACRAATAPGAARAGIAAAFGYGLRAGARCAVCCSPLMGVAVLLGVMDLRVMTLATAAIAAERLLPRGERWARGTGVLVVGLGLLLAVVAARDRAQPADSHAHSAACSAATRS